LTVAFRQTAIVQLQAIRPSIQEPQHEQQHIPNCCSAVDAQFRLIGGCKVIVLNAWQCVIANWWVPEKVHRHSGKTGDTASRRKQILWMCCPTIYADCNIPVKYFKRCQQKCVFGRRSIIDRYQPDILRKSYADNLPLYFARQPIPSAFLTMPDLPYGSSHTRLKDLVFVGDFVRTEREIAKTAG
jgi:hypothetical protein